MAKVVFVGDTSLRSPHFGCQLVGQTFREQFCRVGLELVASLPTKLEETDNWQRVLDRGDLIVINGEGSIHHGRFQNLIDLGNSYPCALVNCVYQENPLNQGLHRFQFISARESMSAQAVRAQGADCEIVPDVLFASQLLNSYVPARPPAKNLGITDCAEKMVRMLGPFRVRYRPGFSPKRSVVREYLDFLSEHRRLCVGRFHAAVAASVLQIPFSSWDSNTWKIRGMMHDMGLSHLHCHNRDDAMAVVPDTCPPSVRRFAVEAKRKVEGMFNRIAELALTA